MIYPRLIVTSILIFKELRLPRNRVNFDQPIKQKIAAVRIRVADYIEKNSLIRGGDSDSNLNVVG